MADDRETVRAANRLEDIIPRLTGHELKRRGSELWTPCTFHDDKNPSLRINPEKQTWFCDPCNEGGDVFRFVEKFRHCDFETALAELSAFLPIDKDKLTYHVAAEFIYQTADGHPHTRVLREESDERDPISGKPYKRFSQWHPDAHGIWMPGKGAGPVPVYRRPEIQGQRILYKFEGEGCAEFARSLGFPSTTVIGGAGKITSDHVQQWRDAGAQAMVVFPDNDAVGQADARKTALLCAQAGMKVKIPQLPELPPKGDIIDWFQAGHTKDQFVDVVKSTALFDPKREDGVLPNTDETYQFKIINGSGYEMIVPRLGIELKVTGVRRHSRGEVTGLMTTRVNFPGAKIIPLTNHVINSADMNLASDRGRRERAKHLAERAQTGDEIDWIGLVDTFCIKVIEAEVAGAAEIPLQQIVVSESTGEVQIGPIGYSLILGHPTLWFGDGGTGKSTQSVIVAVELAKQGKNVLYIDLEGAGDQHKRTADAYTGVGVSLPGIIIYQSLDRPLVQDAAKIFELIAKYRVDVVIIDSVGFACDGSPESAEAATSFYRAVRSFGHVTTLLIAHVNRSEQGDQKPFGSVFWSNGARNMWYLKRSEVDTNENEFTVGFYHRKSNMGPLRAPFGVRLCFDPHRLTAVPANLSEIAELALKLPVWQRIKQYLERASMPVDESMLSSELELPPTIIQKTVSRFTNTFYKETDGRVGLRLVSSGGEVF